MERPNYGAPLCTASECRSPKVELLDDEPARGHDFLYNVCRWLLAGLVCPVFVGLRLMQMAIRSFQNSGHQFTGSLHLAWRCFVDYFSMVPEKLGASRGRNRISLLQWIRVWSLLDNGTSRMADPGLAEHSHPSGNLMFSLTSSPVTSPEKPAHLKLLQLSWRSVFRPHVPQRFQS